MRNATTRSYFPSDAKSRLVWTNNHLTALEQLADELDVPAAFITAARADLAHLEAF
ncbi:MAG: hypothetical protein LBK99_11270 [Opitutaceae bacterium]|nr:hypothetical protein [Opitutaceae bacterium]